MVNKVLSFLEISGFKFSIFFNIFVFKGSDWVKNKLMLSNVFVFLLILVAKTNKHYLGKL